MNSTTQRSHDYAHLIARWRGIVRRSDLAIRPFAIESGFQVFVIQSKSLDRRGGIYISAGIHGDEPGATEGLLAWAETCVDQLGELPLLIFPCLNPWGLVNNNRMDALGNDLNRMFQHDNSGAIHELKQLIKPYHFDSALMLHEDYDGQGVYLYELLRSKPFWGETLLESASRHIPLDPRSRIDGRKAVDGVVRRKIDPRRFRKIGLPEAIYLHTHHATRTFTVETPSEFDLSLRTQAHAAMLQKFITLTRNPG